MDEEEEEEQEEDDSEGEVSEEGGEQRGPRSNDDVQQLEENPTHAFEALSKSTEKSKRHGPRLSTAVFTPNAARNR